ncbi:hypothetical protein LWI29_009154 [Acer saccharum]|uniref:Uncharacterized protein n=1 Tax=Acer saccharum TaxID=4024 RepID=A0AA39VSQ3_ACESA|nr:hypothetical protein LWI29_009154 [Acer saccharum]
MVKVMTYCPTKLYAIEFSSRSAFHPYLGHTYLIHFDRGHFGLQGSTGQPTFSKDDWALGQNDLGYDKELDEASEEGEVRSPTTSNKGSSSDNSRQDRNDKGCDPLDNDRNANQNRLRSVIVAKDNEEEITKVIEKGVALGLDWRNGSKKACNGDGNNEDWDVEEEVKKVMETGAALGFDFNGNEEEIYKVVSTRECEDEARLSSQV